MTEPWPTDPEFRRFAAKVADGVMRSRANGWKISPNPDLLAPPRREHCCPVGAALEMLGFNANPYPGSETISRSLGMCPENAWCFMEGFDGVQSRTGPYYRLGRAYRQRAKELGDWCDW